MDKIYVQSDDGRIQPLGEISEMELTALDDSTDYKSFLDCEPIEISCDFGNTDILRAVLSQGEYNAYVLKRDGYLSPENGWIK